MYKRKQVIAFLNTKLRNKEEDPDERWITTWNDYLWLLKMFYRWLYNFKIKEENQNKLF
jgi:integrase/recombinase XerD